MVYAVWWPLENDPVVTFYFQYYIRDILERFLLVVFKSLYGGFLLSVSERSVFLKPAQNKVYVLILLGFIRRYLTLSNFL